MADAVREIILRDWLLIVGHVMDVSPLERYLFLSYELVATYRQLLCFVSSVSVTDEYSTTT